MPLKQPFHLRIKDFRLKHGYTQQSFAEKLGVSFATITRWETKTSKPSRLAVEALSNLGFGEIDDRETNEKSISRLDRISKEELRKAIKQKLHIGGKQYLFEPSPYIINGPEDQLSFFKKLLKMQEESMQEGSLHSHLQRISVVSEINGIATAQAELESPKNDARSWNSNYGTHGWHRYIGRFPPHLVRALINKFKLQEGSTLLDPFVGSGTTMVESRLLGLKGIGTEICPLSALISRAKSQFPEDPKSLFSTVERFSDFYTETEHCFLRNNTIEFTHQDVIDRKGNQIKPFVNYEKWFTEKALLGTSITVEFIAKLTGYERDFFSCQLSSVMRSIGNVEVNVVRAEYSKKPRESVNVLKLMERKLAKSIRSIEKSLSTHHDVIGNANSISILENGIQSAEIDEGSIDAIITSPPYGVESISYLRTHLLSYRSLEPILGHDPYSGSKYIIGSEYLTKPEYIVHEAANLSDTYRNFFSKFDESSDPKKLWTRVELMMKFFDDMVLTTKLMSKWLKIGGHLAFVVGNKKLGDHVIPTHQIMKDIFESNGLCETELIKHKLKTNNSNSQVPWQDKIIQDEYIMIYTKRQ